jgi:hypothetical protein
MPRRASLLALVAAALVAAALTPATASTVEQATVGVVAYQYDGDTYHDAPDGCGDASPTWSVAVGSSTDGILVPPDDERDAYVVDVPPSLVGHRLHLGVTEPSNAQDLRLDAFVPGCASSILDAVNWPTPEPSPPAPAAGETQVALPMAPSYCYAKGWAFVIDGLKGLPRPAAVDVAWTDGSERTVGLSWAREGYAVYVSGDDLGVTLKGAWANVASAWSGQSWLAGPCDASDGGAVYGDKPTVGLGALAFTPVRAGPHVLLVSWGGGALPPARSPGSVDLDRTLFVEPHEIVQDPQGSAERIVDFVRDPPPPQDLLPVVSAPASCHFCLKGAEDGAGQVSYGVSVQES